MNKIIILLSLILITSCNIKDNKGNIDIDSIKAELLRVDEFEIIHIDSLLLSKPHLIKYYPDDMLLIKDPKGGEMATVVDIRLNRVTPLVKMGRASNELLSLRDIIDMNGDIYLYSITDGKMLKMEFNSSHRCFEFSKLFNFDGAQYFRVFPHPDGSFVALSGAGSNSRLTLLDSAGKVISEGGEFPYFEDLSKCDNSFMQSVITLSPKGDRIAVACMSLDHIAIFDSRLNTISHSYGQFCNRVKFKSKSNEIVNRILQYPFYFAYENIISNNDGIWIGYLGMEATEENFESAAIRKIINFSWSGKIKKVYELEKQIISFDIDFENNTLYCITREAEPKIIRRKL